MRYQSIFFFLFFSGKLLAQIAPTIQFIQENSPESGYFICSPIDSTLLKNTTINRQKLFPIYTGAESPKDPNYPAMLGTYSWGKDFLRFTPRFPLLAGMSYYAEWNQAYFEELQGLQHSQAPKVSAVFTLPENNQAPTTLVEQVYPTTNLLPENQLKFYIHFSAPMRSGQGLTHIRVLDEEGQEIKPFLPMPEELWDTEQKRLTLFLDPGRIKRGLVPHEEFGTPLKAGNTYTLLIEKSWKDAQGRPLKETFVKKFQTQQADRTMPQADPWVIESPSAASRDALVVQFQEVLDAALAQRCLLVLDDQGNKITGQVTLHKQESEWHFIPEKPWNAGAYRLYIDRRLEDLAGNNLRKLFDTDTRHDQSPLETRHPDFATRVFMIRAKP